MTAKTILMALMLVPTAVNAQQEWTLRQCIDHAIANNINIKRQETNVKSQEVSLNSAKNNRLPSLNASAGQSFNFGRGLTIDNTYANRNTQSTSFNIGADVPIYTGGQISNNIKARKLDLQAAIVDLQYAKDNISMQVASAYLEALFQKDLLEVSRQQAELSKAQERRINILFQNGKCAETDLAEIQASVANDELSLTQQQNSYTLALLTLSQLLELPSPEGFDIARPEILNPENTVLTDPNQIYAEASLIKPLIEAENIRLKSAERNIRIARSGYYPNINLGVGMGTNYYKTSGFPAASFNDQMRDNLNKSISLSLSIPIFNRFSTRNQIRSAKLQYQNQQLQLDETHKSLYKEIQQAYYNALAAQKQCVSSMQAEKASTMSFNLMEKKYTAGKATATEYQESKNALFKATTNRLQAQYTFLFRQKILDFYRGIQF
jgi:outer membrane protein